MAASTQAAVLGSPTYTFSAPTSWIDLRSYASDSQPCPQINEKIDQWFLEVHPEHFKVPPRRASKSSSRKSSVGGKRSIGGVRRVIPSENIDSDGEEERARGELAASDQQQQQQQQQQRGPDKETEVTEEEIKKQVEEHNRKVKAERSRKSSGMNGNDKAPKEKKEMGAAKQAVASKKVKKRELTDREVEEQIKKQLEEHNKKVKADRKRKSASAAGATTTTNADLKEKERAAAKEKLERAKEAAGLVSGGSTKIKASGACKPSSTKVTMESRRHSNSSGSSSNLAGSGGSVPAERPKKVKKRKLTDREVEEQIKKQLEEHNKKVKADRKKKSASAAKEQQSAPVKNKGNTLKKKVEINKSDIDDFEDLQQLLRSHNKAIQSKKKEAAAKKRTQPTVKQVKEWEKREGRLYSDLTKDERMTVDRLIVTGGQSN